MPETSARQPHPTASTRRRVVEEYWGCELGSTGRAETSSSGSETGQSRQAIYRRQLGPAAAPRRPQGVVAGGSCGHARGVGVVALGGRWH